MLSITCNLQSYDSSGTPVYVGGGTYVLSWVRLHKISDSQGVARVHVGSRWKRLAIGSSPEDIERPGPTDLTGKYHCVSHGFLYPYWANLHYRFQWGWV